MTKDRETQPFVIATLLGFGFALMMALFLAAVLSEYNANRAEAIERGYALYCPDNGQWAWVGECEE